MREQTHLQNSIDACENIERELSDNIELLKMGEEEGDSAITSEAEEAIRNLAQRASQMETQGLFSGEADSNDCFLEIHAGAGGTESCDWAAMLLRMYTRWAEQHNYKVEFIEENSGEEAGIKSATIKISGQYAYGWAKTESGVHRLVRISPFDSANRRHTSFASVWVYPVIDETIDIEIEEKDLQVDTMRSGGAGGQHVNKTESAIRITHIPTGIVVKCQNDRSQHRNRAEAMSMLKARLYELELRKKEEAAQEERSLLSRVKRAFFIIWISAATLAVTMLPIVFIFGGVPKLVGFAITTLAGVAIGVLITRPAYAVILKSFLTNK